MEPTVCIIVLNYRLADQVGECLRSLRSLRYPSYRLVVVDNDSGDGLAEMLEAEFPEVVFIQTGENLGYTGGNNRGLAWAMEEGADYALILNPDTVVINPDFVGEMVRYLEAHRDTGIAGPRVFQSPGEVQNTVLQAPGLWRNFYHWFLFRLAPASLVRSGDQVVEAEVLNGVCLLIRLECLREIGLFDERYFMYIEDADLDWRARRAGWRVCYLPVDSILHLQKRDSYQLNGPVDFLLKRNSFYYLLKQGRRLEAIGLGFLMLAAVQIRGLMSFDRKNLSGAFRFNGRLIAAWREMLRFRIGPTKGE